MEEKGKEKEQGKLNHINNCFCKLLAAKKDIPVLQTNSISSLLFLCSELGIQMKD